MPASTITQTSQQALQLALIEVIKFANSRFLNDSNVSNKGGANNYFQQQKCTKGIPIKIFFQSGQTALHLALKRSYVDVALFLITKGCNLDIQDEVVYYNFFCYLFKIKFELKFT